ncbi:probable helicase MAGATAMA 3 isoform X2 [Benincasa hispida]|uniref:probable helicase MAGATAMA 3 isoform X2 n=1 Tax=Benincasa hispida TaxID=102211 RepID=UPI001901A3BF|nr:probable helicase MAGATAMA 3 isoform X2 [Benincasa hispida]XP_038881791.1 probable helicase MAGATAMA 3 isoform X2 [Benincasa hispida]
MAVDKEKVAEESVTSRLFKIILSWDYFRLLKNSKKHKEDVGDGASLGLKEVKSTYKDVDDYISTFEPLLLEEIKAQIIQRNDDEEAADWKFRAIVECSEVNGFHFPEIVYLRDEELNDEDSGKGEFLSPNDLLLLSKEKFQENARLPTTYAFALVESRQQSKLRLRMYLAGEVTHKGVEAIVSSPRLLKVRSHITSSSKDGIYIYSLKICSLSTIIREYIALWSISSLPFREMILAAADKNTGKDQAWKISRPLQEYMQENLNESQQAAVQAGLSRKPFVLIQGPPGTGKTQTILGLLSAILHATPARMHTKIGLIETRQGSELPVREKYNHWNQASPWLNGINPRDNLMPVNGDDGFFPTTGNELKPEVVKSNRKYRVRVLVCAPSNSALDEIVLRVQNTGVRDENDHSYTPKIVRIGLKPHPSIKAVSMKELVEQKKNSMNTGKEKSGASGTDLDSIRSAILDESVIVFSTLSFSGSSLFSKWNRGFDVVIIDEAAQAVELATLVPLANGCKQVFLVGDPEQLPATVISTTAKKFGYDKSLFKRFQSAGYPVTMLKIQYRMHPEIRSFPSREFYAESLEDAPDVKLRTTRAWHAYRCYGPFCFFDLHEGKESQPPGSGSWVNIDEAEFVILLYYKLVTSYPELKSNSQVAIISPYSQQVKLLQEKFTDTFGMDPSGIVDITSVDGCQGREKDIAIFSCVRASENRSIGFLSDCRRMNVGITRARASILVVGSASTLKRDEHWNNLVESARKRDCLYKVSKPYTTFLSDENVESMRVKNEPPVGPTGDRDETEANAPQEPNAGDANQAQADENDFGDGEEEMYEGGFEED